ncbi:hypothetical protein ACOMHN_033888 [Nucella lapillus]
MASSSLLSNPGFDSRLANGRADTGASLLQGQSSLTHHVDVHASLNASPSLVGQPVISGNIPEITLEEEEADPLGLGPHSGARTGGGSRLKNRTGVRGGVTPQYRVADTADSRVGQGGQESVGGAGGLGLSHTSSYSSVTGSTAGAGNPAKDGSGRDSSGGGGGRGVGGEKGSLTVQGTWKVEHVLKTKEVSRGSGVWKLAVAKWITVSGLGVLLLASLVAAKVAVLILGNQLFLHRAPQGKEKERDWSKYTAQYIVLYMYLTVPPALMALRALWYGLLDTTVPWPSTRAVLLAVFSSGAESLGLCVMCFSVLGRYQPPVSLLLLTLVLLIPAFNVLPLARAQRREGRVRPSTVVFVVVGVLFLLAGTALVGVLLAKTAPADYNLWHPAVAIVCLSVAWLPSLQRSVSTGRRQTKAKRQQGPKTYGTFSNGSIASDDGYDTTTTLTTTASTTASITSLPSQNATTPRSGAAKEPAKRFVHGVHALEVEPFCIGGLPPGVDTDSIPT